RSFIPQPLLHRHGDLPQKLLHVVFNRFWLAALTMMQGHLLAPAAGVARMVPLAVLGIFDVDCLFEILRNSRQRLLANLLAVAFEESDSVLAERQHKEPLAIRNEIGRASCRERV